MDDQQRVTRTAVRSVSAWFFLNGFTLAAWVAHVPRLKEDLHTTTGPLGLALLCMSAGAVLGMTLAPKVTRRVGAARAAWRAGIIMAVLLGVPLSAGTVTGLGLALLAFGAANGIMDVTMNTAAAAVERDLGRPVMSSFHGWFSVGMVLGVLGGVAALSAGLPPLAHAGGVLALAGVLLFAAPPTGIGNPPEATGAAPAATDTGGRVFALAALAFVSMFLEGAVADWSGLLSAGYGADAATAPLAYVAFTVTWAAGRFAGDALTRAAGDVVMGRLGGVLAAAGILVGVLSESPLGVAAGCAVIGLGLANVVPILFRAAAAIDPSGRGTAMATVTGVGYAGFLVGPPAVGFLAEAIGLPRALLLVVVGGAALAAGAGALRPRAK
ncbi:membrane protein : Major facilitator superfamily MFS_1 OS=Burkholderia sp. H160 GN=BH160DRAFT_0238 PE=4 SV=1: MFS_1 [Gemmataceae bacterium]|nr:membrane protein : Major facilitator superfamily MFS_1 OS=Burkholderia sp. H160 GN=BH160DRAFT_0238 PE=4 SV=1: MFS_1 [Gemmataceae bacterium]VTT96865.1 membrane protein : Major facilitator superfamily MFS_1 OS=Burkholderia sp. H160 GN=BH160DRAFT_0238 PE=4 SV=1: MFS_1 [Gemmataceae bacterium]